MPAHEVSNRARRGFYAAALGVVVLGVIAYALFGTSTEVDGSKMAALVVHSTGIPTLKRKPEIAMATAASKSGLPAVERAAKSAPTRTGVYQIAWTSARKKMALEAGLSVDLLPSTGYAAEELDDLTKSYTDTKSLSAQSLTLDHRFNVPGVPGAFGGTYSMKGSDGAPNSTVYLVLYRIGSVVVFELSETASSALTQSEAASLAAAEAAKIRSVGVITLGRSVRPGSTALWFALGTVVVAGSVALTPAALQLVGHRRDRRAQRLRRNTRRHVQSRGSKVVSRQRVRPVGARSRSR